MYRPILAATVAAFLLVIFAALPVKAQTSEGICISKDEIIEMWTVGEPSIRVQKVTDTAAQVLDIHLRENGVGGGDSFILFWMEGEEYPGILIATFDPANCFVSRVKGPRDDVLKLVAGLGA